MEHNLSNMQAVKNIQVWCEEQTVINMGIKKYIIKR